jgi:NAD/NADP transhydrogenase beta subunit
MLLAVAASFLNVFTVDTAARPHLWINLGLALVALILGASAAWFKGRSVAMTEMPQMVYAASALPQPRATAKRTSTVLPDLRRGTHEHSHTRTQSRINIQ